jgi:hypothetical protein
MIYSGHWHFTRKDNTATLQKLSKCFLPVEHENYTPCPDRPVVINGYWWSALVALNGTAGEVSISFWPDQILILTRTVHMAGIYCMHRLQFWYSQLTNCS